MAVEGHVWLWKTIYSSGGLCIAVEGMCSCRCQCIGVEGHV